jgi:hypothetical protein
MEKTGIGAGGLSASSSSKPTPRSTPGANPSQLLGDLVLASLGETRQRLLMDVYSDAHVSNSARATAKAACARRALTTTMMPAPRSRMRIAAAVNT